MSTLASKNLDDVVITGLGVIAPNGFGIDQFWHNTLSGCVTTRRLTRFHSAGLRSDKGGEVVIARLGDYFRAVDADSVSLSTQFAVAAAHLCIDDARAKSEIENSSRAGVSMGSVSACRPAVEGSRNSVSWHHARDRVLATPCELSRTIAREWQLSGPNVTLTTACAAGNSAIAWATDAIRLGRADMMIAGGADELSYAMLAYFSRLRALSPDLVRPFDTRRNGLILAEGAGAILLERRKHAIERGARIYCKIAGYGSFSDAYHMTAPHPQADGAVQSIRGALEMANLKPEDIGFVSAHGTATVQNDAIEADAIRLVFGVHRSPPVSALKSQIGHAQGAASAIESVACILSLARGLIHPTANVTAIDPHCELDLVTSIRTLSKPAVLNNAFGFGGNICCIVFSK